MSSNTSIGSGTANDDNENPAPDHRPSKTMGAESGPDRASPSSPPDTAASSDLLTSPGELLRGPSVTGVPVDSQAQPDGPNVGPSPWEKDAAEG
ncbi:hypothetical protein [Polaromonas sp.]|uniref:hypothetical protein n=1 Tax=Polaromonas sp. TaxID=1869339 RepID=UPI003264CEDC